MIHIGEKSPYGVPDRSIEIPDRYVGLIIGRAGDNLKLISSATNTKIFMPHKTIDSSGVRILEICGEDMFDIDDAERRIRMVIDDKGP